VVPKANSRKVTVRYKTPTEEVLEVYTAADGTHLAAIAADSALIKATAGANPTELPKVSEASEPFVLFKQGTNGGAPSGDDLKQALESLLNEAVHIVVAAGMGDKGTEAALKAHCEAASTDKLKADRIAVVGSDKKTETATAVARSVESERIVYVTPGIKVPGAQAGEVISLPAAYTAAAIAGMLSALDPHISLTNKPVAVPELEKRYTQSELKTFVENGLLALEDVRGRGVRVVKGITATPPGTPFHQITTRRIVDFAKYGVRSAASPYIGRLNNERVRAALKSTVTSFLQEMLDDEMLVKFEVDVFATRLDEIKGIANVTILLQPTFSIDFVKVTMILS
jgi:hypothetical protein